MVGSIRGVAAVVVAVTLGVVQAAGAQSKLVNPVYGEAQIQITKPATKMVGGDVVTTVLVKNVDKAPIAGFVAEEYLVPTAPATRSAAAPTGTPGRSRSVR